MTQFKTFKITAALTLSTMLILGGTAAAAPPAQSGKGGPLKAFGNGDVLITSSNSATIALDDDDESGGVLINSKKQSGRLLSDVDFAFTSSGDVAGGAPRFSIPIDDGSFDPNTDYAFIDAANCGATVGDNPDQVATLVSTQNPECDVFFHGTDYENWAAFAAANPTYRIAKSATPFIIADALPPGETTAVYEVTNIFLG
ncbi:hypothetical protein [Nannocystis sp. SCPEA4]|uniref:hypothetical protein n=1 Tax=Nannocystis sp. SCPEA4 TaxID=2996787 RepID=UPI00226F3BB1|nr:hypothetical protein [Nannocystis sp. SCPEA4]MCY1057273.1 hypothetical protein [Nannocystis sp. SCPEA4]